MSDDAREITRSRARVLDAAPDHHDFTWPLCDICNAPMDFHSIQDDPTWFCGECGTV
jgi:hypothetical protein